MISEIIQQLKKVTTEKFSAEKFQLICVIQLLFFECLFWGRACNTIILPARMLENIFS